jgi:hypothetical protein
MRWEAREAIFAEQQQHETSHVWTLSSAVPRLQAPQRWADVVTQAKQMLDELWPYYEPIVLKYLPTPVQEW